MLKLTMKPGEFLNIGSEIKVVFSGGSSNNIHLLIDAPRNLNIKRNKAGTKVGETCYYAENKISPEAQRKIVDILRREKLKNME